MSSFSVYIFPYNYKSLKMTAKEKWDYDKKKIEYAKELGYEVMIVWESEWEEDKDLVIEKCKEFIC